MRLNSLKEIVDMDEDELQIFESNFCTFGKQYISDVNMTMDVMRQEIIRLRREVENQKKNVEHTKEFFDAVHNDYTQLVEKCYELIAIFNPNYEGTDGDDLATINTAFATIIHDFVNKQDEKKSKVDLLKELFNFRRNYI